MDEEQTRACLAKWLKRENIPDPVWNSLVRKDLVRSDLRVGDVEWRDLVSDAQEQLKLRKEILEEAGTWGKHKRAAGEGTTSEVVELDLGTYEKARAEALGEYVALRAAVDRHARYFRKLVLGGETLTPEEADAFVRSPANACFDIEWFLGRQIPMKGHVSHVHRDGWAVDEEENEYRFDDVYVEPPGEVFRKVAYDHLDIELRDALNFPRGDDFVHNVDKIPVEVGSVLDLLRRVSARLVEKFGNAWGEAQATWLVLTGEATPVTALTGRIKVSYGERMTHGTIAMAAEPWVSSQTVARYYRSMQKEMLGKDNRPLSERGLALFHFVMRQHRSSLSGVAKPDPEVLAPGGGASMALSEYEWLRSELGSRISWRTLQERWNRNCERAEWRYGDVRNFRRAFLGVARVLLASPYPDPLELVFVPTEHALPQNPRGLPDTRARPKGTI